MSEQIPNEFTKKSENDASLLKRLFIYQKERFPLLGHGLLMTSFTFSAIAYSRICRGVEGFISLKLFGLGVFMSISLFLLVRIFDEFKDAEDDAKYRKELPVPRGLVSLRELFWIGLIVFVLQITVNLIFFPKMLIIYFAIIAYLSLMGKEFFIAEWLKKHQFWYVTSHMFIIPLIDIYASGLDWFLEGASAPTGLLFFFAVSYMNGIVLEIGRKIRAPEQESEGVLTYTKMLGITKSINLWILILFLTLVLAISAAYYAGYGMTGTVTLGSIFIVCCIPAILFSKNHSVKMAKGVEISSALWTIAMYLSLGGIPMIRQLFID